MATIGARIDPEEISRWLLRGNNTPNPQMPAFNTVSGQSLPTTAEEFGQRLDQYFEQVEKPAKDAALQQQQEIAAGAPPAKPNLFERIAAAQTQAQQAEIASGSEAIKGFGEAALSTASGLAGGASSLATVAAGTVMAPILGLMKTPEKRATYWKDLVEAAKEISSKQTYEPRTEIGKVLLSVPNAVMETIGKISEGASEAALAKLLLTPDQRELLKYAHELVTIGLLTEGTIKALGPVRGKMAKFKSEFAKADDATALVTAAEDLTISVQSNPTAVQALQEARQKLIDTMSKHAGERAQAEPTLPGVTMPTQVQGELPLRPARPLPSTPTREAAQLTLPLDTELFAPRNKTTAEMAVMTPDEYLIATGRTQRDVNFRDFVSKEFLPMVQDAFEGGLVPQNIKDVSLRKQYVENLRGALATARYDPMSLEGVRGDIVRALDPDIPTATRQTLLRDIKARVRDDAQPSESIRRSLTRLGMTVDEIAEIEGPLRNVRAQRAVQPTVSVPSPSSKIEPSSIISPENMPAIIDTAPAIVKPTRVRVPRKKIIAEEPETTTPTLEELVRARESEMSSERIPTPKETIASGGEINAGYAYSVEPSPYIVPSVVEYNGYNYRRTGPTWQITGPGITKSLVANSEVGAKARIDRLNASKSREQRTRAVSMGLETTPPLYTPMNTFTDVKASIDNAAVVGGVDTPVKSAIQVRTVGGKPDALLIDTTGLNTIQSIASIRREVEQGRIAPDIAQALENNLQRQSAVGGVSLEQAHNFTGERLLKDAMRLAYDQNIELYRMSKTKTGIEYEQIPRNVIRVSLELQDLNPLEPLVLSKEDAATYVAEKSRPVGPVVIEEITTALETLTDITDRLPAEVQPHFQELLEARREGLDVSNSRPIKKIFQDLVDLLLPYDPTELGSLALFGLSDVRKAAALRLWGDITKKNKSFKEMLDATNMPEAEKILFMRYIDSVRKPDLPVGITAPELRFDPRQGESTNPIMHQRTVRRNGVDVPQTPLHYSDLMGAYNAKDLPSKGIQGLTTIGPFQPGAANVSHGTNIKSKTFLEPYYALRRANWMELMYAYRASERAGARESKVFEQDLNQMARVHNRESRERIGEYGYSNSMQGINILIKNNKDIPTLSASEQITYNALRETFDAMWTRVNEVREAEGKPLLDYIDDYIPFMRAMSLAEKLGEPINLLSANPVMIYRRVDTLAALQFPRAIARTGAVYRAEFDAFRLTQDFMRQALPQIHMEPFLAKLRELISEDLPDPSTGQPTWKLSEQKPQLYAYLQDWHNRLVSRVEPTFSPIGEKVVNTGMRWISGGVLGLGARSALVQLNTLKLASHAIGPYRLLQGAYDAAADGVRYFFNSEGTKIGELFRDSQVLDTRGIQDAYSDVTAAIVGRSPKDFIAALRSGQLRQIESAFDSAVTYKFMNIFDSMAATVTGLGAKRLVDHIASVQKSKSLPVMDKIAQRNFIDDVIIQVNGGTMPGDLPSVFRSTGSRALLQFQRFVVHDWNYFIEDVLGAGGRKDIARLLDRDPNKYLPAVIKSMLAMAAATIVSTIIYEDVIGMQSPNATPIRTMLKSIDQNDSVMKTAGKVALELVEGVPGLSSTRYGKGIGGPLIQTMYEAQQSLAGKPLAYQLFKDSDTLGKATARLYGSPLAKLTFLRGAGQVGKMVRGDDRGQDLWPSLLGMYQPTQPGGSGVRELRRAGSTVRQVP